MFHPLNLTTQQPSPVGDISLCLPKLVARPIPVHTYVCVPNITLQQAGCSPGRCCRPPWKVVSLPSLVLARASTSVFRTACPLLMSHTLHVANLILRSIGKSLNSLRWELYKSRASKQSFHNTGGQGARMRCFGIVVSLTEAFRLNSPFSYICILRFCLLVEL